MSLDVADLILVTEADTAQTRTFSLENFLIFIADNLPAAPGSYTDEEARDAIGAALVEGAGISIVIDDGSDTITIACTITQYTDGMADARVAAGIATHEAAPDPHPGYLTTAEGNAAYETIGAVAAHVGQADPHTQYLKESDFNLSTFDTGDLAEGANLYHTSERVDDRVAALIQNGTGITWSYDDGANTLTPTVTITQYTDEMVDDRVAALLVEGTNVTLTYDDGANTLTIDAAAGAAEINQTEVDFGATPVASATFTVSHAGVTAASNIMAQLAYVAPTGKDLDELEMDKLSIICAPGTDQFDMLIEAVDGSYLHDKFKINYLVG